MLNQASGERLPPEIDDGGWGLPFRLLFERSSDALALIDEHRRFVDLNTPAELLLGRRRQGLIGESALTSMTSADREQSVEHWRALLQAGHYAGTHTLVRADGTEVSASVNVVLSLIRGRRLAVCLATPVYDPPSRQLDAARRVKRPLTARERQVISLIAIGRETPAIAATLHLAPATVRAHVRNAMTKLDVSTRAQLVAVAQCQSCRVGRPWSSVESRLRPLGDGVSRCAESG